MEISESSGALVAGVHGESPTLPPPSHRPFRAGWQGTESDEMGHVGQKDTPWVKVLGELQSTEWPENSSSRSENLGKQWLKEQPLLGSISEGRTQGIPPPPVLERQANKGSHSLLEQRLNYGTSARGGKLTTTADLLEAQYTHLCELKTPGDPVTGELTVLWDLPPGLNKVPTVNTREKSPLVSGRERGKGIIFKYSRALCS